MAARKGAGGGGAKPPAKPRARARAKAPPAPPLPDARGEAPLHELERDALSVFLYVALVPDESRALVKELELSVPGFRTEALGDVQRCDVLADEIRARPEVGARVLEVLRKAYGRVALHTAPLDEVAADDLLGVTGTENGLPLALWRVLADPAPAIRARALPVLEDLAKEYYGPLPEGAGEAAPAPAQEARGEAAALARVKELEKALARAEERAESTRKKGEEAREKLQEWLKEARARAAQAVDDAARAREAAQGAQAGRERAEAALAAAQATDAAADAQRARAAAHELEGKVARLQSQLERQELRAAELEAALEKAEARARSAPAAAAAAAGPDADTEDAAEAATWLRPVFTREFYDSIEGWDQRIQRAAFKQANLLALDHRHPSLRALPLEGLPGYYRVRVATDVRLLYRRAERQNEIEILSLIDREDLDRYVRQAKTR